MGVCLPLRARVTVQLFKPPCALALTSSCDGVYAVDSFVRPQEGEDLTHSRGFSGEAIFTKWLTFAEPSAHLSASTLAYLQSHRESTLKRAALIEVTFRAYRADTTQLPAVKQLRGFKRRTWR